MSAEERRLDGGCQTAVHRAGQEVLRSRGPQSATGWRCFVTPGIGVDDAFLAALAQRHAIRRLQLSDQFCATLFGPTATSMFWWSSSPAGLPGLLSDGAGAR